MGWDGVPHTSQDGHATDVTNSESRARTPVPPPVVLTIQRNDNTSRVDRIQMAADILLSDPG